MSQTWLRVTKMSTIKNERIQYGLKIYLTMLHNLCYTYIYLFIYLHSLLLCNYCCFYLIYNNNNFIQ